MENNLFKIHSDYKPTGDQPTAIDSIVKNIENGVKDQVLLGVTGSGKTFTIAPASVVEVDACLFIPDDRLDGVPL